jgi:hydrogenase maturation factor HypF (carbamoyltransferase family)
MTSALQLHIGSDQRERIQLTIHGTVQGIGFRPFVFRLAQALSLGGWIANTTQETLLELEGTQAHLRIFQKRITTELPLSGNIRSASPVAFFKIPCSLSFPKQNSQNAGLPSIHHSCLAPMTVAYP